MLEILKTNLLVRKIPKYDILITLSLLSAVILSGCSIVRAVNGSAQAAAVENVPELNLPPVYGSEAAREATLNFIQENYWQANPTTILDWNDGEILSGELVGSTSYQYRAEDWIADVSFPLVAPDVTIYTVKIEGGDHGFSWDGLIDANGRVVTTRVAFDEDDSTDPPVIKTLDYLDDNFKIALEYPADWSLRVESAGDGSADAAKALRFQKGPWVLVLYYKFRWDDTILGGGLPLGEVVERGSVTLLGRSVPRHFVVHDGKDKVMYLGDRIEDLEFYIHLSADPGTGENYYNLDLPEFLPAEVDNIVATIIRTGDPAASPTLAPIPPTPTPKTYCDWAAFVKDVTIPDGTALKTGETFVKTWRLRNRGTCTWTPDYALVFSSSAQMGDTVAVKIPDTVPPGAKVDVSVALTAPSAPGDYRGYWMLRNASGTLFGLGEYANKAFFVDIHTVNRDLGSVSGRICFPGERIPPMTLYFQNMDKNKLTEFSIRENQTAYQVQLELGNYLTYAWVLNFELSGGYTHADHRLRTFEVTAGGELTGVDICDWYGEPGTIPLPSPDHYGTISGQLSYPSEQIPPLRVIAFDRANDAYHWVDTIANQQTFEITNLLPGIYSVVAYESTNGLVGGYTESVKCGFTPSCSEDHDLVIIHVDPGLTVKDINPADWYAPAGTFPSDPTR